MIRDWFFEPKLRSLSSPKNCQPAQGGRRRIGLSLEDSSISSNNLICSLSIVNFGTRPVQLCYQLLLFLVELLDRPNFFNQSSPTSSKTRSTQTKKLEELGLILRSFISRLTLVTPKYCSQNAITALIVLLGASSSSLSKGLNNPGLCVWTLLILG
ncbi:hypothetical protein PtA15_4A451 [Puccinia triticina]|uniref:Uncharacterized protein n=1 Tax=Puccinia triticina TaxID=208348 RepID=A0ABY7CGW8_9BASI|nr:uncharacterized protein PtA15_4A451 [Puccinia triticina]WAQ84000.1 hypothetical protein PtA15_4A451 [Puccinia triticina]